MVMQDMDGSYESGCAGYGCVSYGGYGSGLCGCRYGCGSYIMWIFYIDTHKETQTKGEPTKLETAQAIPIEEATQGQKAWPLKGERPPIKSPLENQWYVYFILVWNYNLYPYKN